MISSVPQYLVGEIVNVNIKNPRENPFTHGKERPGLLVAKDGGDWMVLGFTTQGSYKTGSSAGCPRTAIRHPERYGLSSPSYLFSNRLARVPSTDVTRHYGFADSELIEDVIEFTGLNGSWAANLRAAVETGGAAWNQLLHLIQDGDALAVIGDTTAVEQFLEYCGLLNQSTKLNPWLTAKLLRSGAVGTDLASLYASNSGRWLKVTPQSRHAIAQFGLTPTTTPGISHAMVGQRGTIRAWIQIETGVWSTLSNPAFLSGVAGIVTAIALEQERRQLKELLEVVSMQLQDVLAALDDAKISGVRGARVDIEAVTRLCEETGYLDETSWLMVQNRGGTITDGQEWALLRLQRQARRITEATNVRDLHRALVLSNESIPVALGILAYLFETQNMFDVLRLRRIMETSPNDFDEHLAALNRNRRKRYSEILATVKGLAIKIASADAVATEEMLLHPFASTSAIESLNQITSLFNHFLSVFEVNADLQPVIAPTWRMAVTDPQQIRRVCRELGPTVAGSATGFVLARYQEQIRKHVPAVAKQIMTSTIATTTAKLGLS